MRGELSDRGLPSNVYAERFVLGSILLRDFVYPSVAAAVSADDFSLEKHRRIYQRMGDLHTRGEKIDRLTLYTELTRHQEAESCDGLGYLVSLDDGLPQVPNLDSYIRMVKDKAILRQIIFVSQHLINRCLLGEEDAGEILASFQESFTQIAATGMRGYSVAELPAVDDSAVVEVEYLRYPELPRGAVVAVTGDSGCGKSTLVAAWARDFNGPVLILDRENPRSAVAERNERIGLKDGPRYRHWGGWLDQEAPQPDAPVIVDWVKLCNTGPLVVVDSLTAFHGGDQNDAGETRAFMHRCRRLADLGATVVVIHHDGKAETAKIYRGSTDFKAAIDAGFHVANFGDGGQLDKLVLRCFKSRFGFAGELAYHYAGGRFIRSDETEARQTVSEQLTVILRLNPGVTAKRFEDLAAARQLGRNRARAFLANGVTAKAVHFEPAAKGGKRYFLAGTEAQGVL
jgi:hypothetical protein